MYCRDNTQFLKKQHELLCFWLIYWRVGNKEQEGEGFLGGRELQIKGRW